MKAILSAYRQPPRKTRLVADLVRGKRVGEALACLENVNKRAASPIKKLLLSAITNARADSSVGDEDLWVKEIRVDKGKTLRRSLPRSRGRATPLKKRTSHVSLILTKIPAPH